MTHPARESLDRQLDRLAREIAPPAHVWQAVSARIHGQRRAARALPIAAGVAAAVLAAAGAPVAAVPLSVE